MVTKTGFRKTAATAGIIFACLCTAALLCLCFQPQRTSKIYTSAASSAAVRAAIPQRNKTEATAETTVNVNTATEWELCTLNKIGSTKAQGIIAEREANGPFHYPEDLLQVKGIGESILDAFRHQISFE